MGAMPPIFVELTARIGQFQSSMGTARAEIRAFDRSHTESMGSFAKNAKLAGAAAGVLAIGMGVLAFKATEMAANFETAIVKLHTTAGESAANLKMVGDGLLDMSGRVGVSAIDLAKGMYMVESGGFHGAAGLAVMEAAAKGARVEGSDLTDTTKAVVSAMVDYKGAGYSAADVTNVLTAATGRGMLTFQDMAAALPNVGAAGATAGIGLGELTSAIATMTQHGTDASKAGTYLRQMIGQFEAPTTKARAAMKGLGIDANQLSMDLSKHGLAGTIEEVQNAITSHLQPSGLVAIETFKKTLGSTQDYNTMLGKLPPNLRSSFGALADMTGGVKSLQAFLQLGGTNLQTFRDNTTAVNAAIHKGSNDIGGYADQQKTMNGQLADAKAAMGALAIKIGQDLLPYATQFLGWLKNAIIWMEQHKTVVEAVAAVIGGVLVVALIAAGVAFVAATWEIMLIVAAVGLVVAAIVYLATHWHQIWGAIVAFMAGVWAAITGGISSAWGAITGFFVGVFNRIKGFFATVWNGIVSFLSGIWNSITSAVSTAWNWVHDTTAHVFGAIKDFFAKWWPLLLAIFATPIFVLMALWNHFHTQITAVATTVWNAIKSFLGTVWNGISSAASAAWQAIHDYIVNPIEAVWAWLQGIWNSIVHFIADKYQDIRRSTVAAWNAVKDAISGPIDSARTAVSSTVQGIFDDITGVFNSILSWLWNLGSQFVSIGASIVQGIISGISGAASGLTSTISGLANSALDAAKSALGINSPSRVFADGVGTSIPEGIALGIQQGAHHAHNAVAALTSGLSGSAQIGGLSGVGAGGAGGSSAGGGVQTVRLEAPIEVKVGEQVLFSMLQTMALRYEQRNGTSAFALSGVK
jgi:TP901 family phage tail tape measure protein